MSGWKVHVDPTRDDGSPMFLRIARAVSEDIRRGRLRGGDSLPSSRSLATSLGVHRNTVLAAYRELSSEGWIDSAKAKRTFVSKEIPILRPKGFSEKVAKVRQMASHPAFALESERGETRDAPLPAPMAGSDAAAWKPVHVTSGRGAMTLGGGVPDVRLVPTEALARAIRRVLRQKPREVLSYGEPDGPEPLRRAIAEMVAATRGLAAAPENVLVTRGSQMAIDLVARSLVSAGDVIAVEQLGYRPAWEAFRAAGARIVAIPIDGSGIDIDKLEELATKERLRGVYVTPHHQLPTTVTLAPARRLRLLELARQKRFFILEDDYDHEFHYEGRPVLPLASADTFGVVVYVGTFSKVLAPGARIGFVVAPLSLVQRLSTLRRFVDRQGDFLLETAVAELIEDGEIQRHIRRTRRIYAERRHHLARLLEKHFGGLLSFEVPTGGLAIWARVSPEISVDAWATRALDEASLVLQAARRFGFDGRSRPFLRLGFAQHDEREAREAIGRMAKTMPRARRAFSCR